MRSGVWVRHAFGHFLEGASNGFMTGNLDSGISPNIVSKRSWSSASSGAFIGIFERLLLESEKGCY